jgi:hypothetical protein
MAALACFLIPLTGGVSVAEAAKPSKVTLRQGLAQSRQWARAVDDRYRGDGYSVERQDCHRSRDGYRVRCQITYFNGDEWCYQQLRITATRRYYHRQPGLFWCEQAPDDQFESDDP